MKIYKNIEKYSIISPLMSGKSEIRLELEPKLL